MLVEGQTEEAFVCDLLRPHLAGRGYSSIEARLIGSPRQRQRRGGIVSWPSARRDILNHLIGDKGIALTTMVDYYGLPDGSDQNAWPGRAGAATLRSSLERASQVETEVRRDIDQGMLDRLGHWSSERFVPFVMMYEFEALLFSECDVFAHAMGLDHLASAFRAVLDQVDSPEEIDNDPKRHPSRRIQDLVPKYDKVLHGNRAAAQIGIPTMRRRCRHFNAWLTKLERLAG